MTRYVDFKKLKSQVGIEAIVGLLSLTLRKQGDSLVGDCPLCGNGREDSSKFNVSPSKGDSGAWNCFGCGEGGNMLDLVAAINDVSIQKAAVYIAEQFDITDCDIERPARRKRKPKTKAAKAKTSGNGSGEEAYEVNSDTPQVERQPATEEDYAGDKDEPCVEDESGEIRFNPPLDWEGLKNLDANHEAILDAGMDPDICAYFQAGYCSRGMMKGRFAVPIHNLGGELVGYCGIALDDREDRFKFPPADKYEQGVDLFNLHRAAESSLYKKKGTGLLIVEDILDVFSAYASGTEAVIATMGGAPTRQHLLRLREIAVAGKQISVLWEKPGEELDKAVAKIAEFSWVRLRYKS